MFRLGRRLEVPRDRGAGRAMTWVIVMAALVAALAPATARATTTVREPASFDVTLCNGDVVHVTGTQHWTFNGNVLTVGTISNLTGVDQTTGTVYHGTQRFFDIVPVLTTGGGVETFQSDLRLVAAGGSSFQTTGVFHITVTADGTVHSLVDNSTQSCP